MSGRDKAGLQNKSSNQKKDDKSLEEKKEKDNSSSTRSRKSTAGGGPGGSPRKTRASLEKIADKSQGNVQRKARSLSPKGRDVMKRITRQSDGSPLPADSRRNSVFEEKKSSPIDRLISKNRSAIKRSQQKQSDNNKSAVEKVKAKNERSRSSSTSSNQATAQQKKAAPEKVAAKSKQAVAVKKETLQSNQRKQSMKILASAIARKKGGPGSARINLIEIAAKKRLLRSSKLLRSSRVQQTLKTNDGSSDRGTKKIAPKSKEAINRSKKIKQTVNNQETDSAAPSTSRLSMGRSCKKIDPKPAENKTKDVSENKVKDVYELDTQLFDNEKDDRSGSESVSSKSSVKKKMPAITKVDAKSLALKKKVLKPVAKNSILQIMKLKLAKSRALKMNKMSQQIARSILEAKKGNKKRPGAGKSDNKQLTKKTRTSSVDSNRRKSDSRPRLGSDGDGCVSPVTKRSQSSLSVVDDNKVREEVDSVPGVEQREQSNPVEPVTNKTDTNSNLFPVDNGLNETLMDPKTHPKLTVTSPTELANKTGCMLDVDKKFSDIDKVFVKSEANLDPKSELISSLKDMDLNFDCMNVEFKPKSEIRRLSSDSKCDQMTEDASDSDALDDSCSSMRKKKGYFDNKKRLQRSVWVRRSLRTVQKSCTDSGEISKLLKMAESDEMECDSGDQASIDTTFSEEKPAADADLSFDFCLKLEESPCKDSGLAVKQPDTNTRLSFDGSRLNGDDVDCMKKNEGDESCDDSSKKEETNGSSVDSPPKTSMKNTCLDEDNNRSVSLADEEFCEFVEENLNEVSEPDPLPSEAKENISKEIDSNEELTGPRRSSVETGKISSCEKNDTEAPLSIVESAQVESIEDERVINCKAVVVSKPETSCIENDTVNRIEGSSNVLETSSNVPEQSESTTDGVSDKESLNSNCKSSEAEASPTDCQAKVEDNVSNNTTESIAPGKLCSTDEEKETSESTSEVEKDSIKSNSFPLSNNCKTSSDFQSDLSKVTFTKDSSISNSSNNSSCSEDVVHFGKMDINKEEKSRDLILSPIDPKMCISDDENCLENNEINKLLSRILDDNLDEKCLQDVGDIVSVSKSAGMEQEMPDKSHDEHFSEHSSSSSSYISAVTDPPLSLDSVDWQQESAQINQAAMNVERKFEDQGEPFEEKCGQVVDNSQTPAEGDRGATDNQDTNVISKDNNEGACDDKTEEEKILDMEADFHDVIQPVDLVQTENTNVDTPKEVETTSGVTIPVGGLREESPEERASKESILGALGLKSLHSLASDGKELEKKVSSSYTGTLKAVIKLNRNGDKKSGARKMFFKQGEMAENGLAGPMESGGGERLEYRICSENDQCESSLATGDSSRKALQKHMRTSSLDEGTSEASLSALPPVQSDSMAPDANSDDKSGKQSNLVIPEKSSSFSIHPGRLCSDICSYCFGKFGCLDTPCHLAQLKNADRQQKILANEAHLKMDSCLCDGCYRYVDRKANCSQRVRKPQQQRSRVTQLTDAQCSVNGCQQPAHHSIRRKWLVKLKKSLANKLDIDMEKNPHLPFPLCAQHYYWVDYLTACGVCKKRLTRNHMYAVGSEAEEMNNALKVDGIPARLSDRLFLCKLCRYYCSIRIKHKDHTGLPPSHKLFLRDYRRKILAYLDISVSESDEESTPPQPPPKSLAAQPNSGLNSLATGTGDQPKPKKRRSKSAGGGSQDVSASKKRKLDVKLEGGGGGENNFDGPQMIDYSFLESYDRTSSGGGGGGGDHREFVDQEGGSIGFSNIASLLSSSTMDERQANQPRARVDMSKPTRIQVKFGNLNIGKLSNLNIGQDSRSIPREKPSSATSKDDEDPPDRPPYLPGEKELPLKGELRKETSNDSNGWERRTLFLQFDEQTKKLWNDLQRPYGNQSSFIRHLVMLEKYWREGSLVLSDTADQRAVKYNNSVKNRVKAFDGKSTTIRAPPPQKARTVPLPATDSSVTVKSSSTLPPPPPPAVSTPSSVLSTCSTDSGRAAVMSSSTTTTTSSSSFTSPSLSAISNLPAVSIVSSPVALPPRSTSASPVPSISLTLQPGSVPVKVERPSSATSAKSASAARSGGGLKVIEVESTDVKASGRQPMSTPPPPPLLKLDANMWQKMQHQQQVAGQGPMRQTVQPLKVIVSSSGDTGKMISNLIAVRSAGGALKLNKVPKIVQLDNNSSLQVKMLKPVMNPYQKQSATTSATEGRVPPLMNPYQKQSATTCTSTAAANMVQRRQESKAAPAYTNAKSFRNDGFIPMISDVRSLAGIHQGVWNSTPVSSTFTPMRTTKPTPSTSSTSTTTGKPAKPTTYYTPILPKPGSLTPNPPPSISRSRMIHSITLTNSAMTIEKAPPPGQSFTTPALVAEKPSISVFREDCAN